MIVPGTGVFVTDAGAEISVRTVHDTSADTMIVEPLYAADVELLDGVAGELRVKAGEVTRGILRRQGNVFAFRRPDKGPSPAITRAALRSEFDQEPQHSAPAQADALEAGNTIVRFLRGDRAVSLRTAKRALSIVDRFIVERERQAGREDDWS